MNKSIINKEPGRIVRRLMRTMKQASLATLDVETGGCPYASLILVACGQDGSPIFMISDLARHSRNIEVDGRISLLFSRTTRDAITQGRATVIGRAIRCDDPLLSKRFLARHTTVQTFVEFTDFTLYRMEVESIHFLAGFGGDHILDNSDVLLNGEISSELMAAEPEILDHMNENHAEAVDIYAQHLIGRPGMDWKMTGIDPEGIDLARNDAEARLDFDELISCPDKAKKELTRLAKAPK
ncbi:MAG: hypothetical protein CMM38_03785 [Rhodospirillaceae bacterium]|nr:hypothetical protein [Rhodospirillaceae bacterium]